MWKGRRVGEWLGIEIEEKEGKGEEEEGEWMERKLLWERRWRVPQKQGGVEGGSRESVVTAIEC